MKSYRQGDIYLKEVKHLPEMENKKYSSLENLKTIDKNNDPIILAYGESTGHKHAIYDGNSFLLKEKNSNRFFLIIIKESELKHEEHASIKLPIGNYEVIRQREYFPDEIRRVAD